MTLICCGDNPFPLSPLEIRHKDSVGLYSQGNFVITCNMTWLYFCPLSVLMQDILMSATFKSPTRHFVIALDFFVFCFLCHVGVLCETLSVVPEKHTRCVRYVCLCQSYIEFSWQSADKFICTQCAKHEKNNVACLLLGVRLVWQNQIKFQPCQNTSRNNDQNVKVNNSVAVLHLLTLFVLSLLHFD